MIIVDDESSAAEELASLIDYNKYSFNVSGCFDSALAALNFIKENPVDLIVSDIKMPDMDGLELLKIINTAFPNIRVILISAHRDFEYARTAVSYNAFEYLTKPISYADYIDALIRISQELANQRKFFPDTEETALFIEETLYDYFNNITSEDFFLKKMNMNNIGYSILNSQCTLAELKINNLENYLNNVWLHGKDRLFNAIKNIIPNSMYGCFAFTVSGSNDSINLIITKSSSTDFEKSKSDFYSYLKNELENILCIDIDITQIHSCASVIALKQLMPTSTAYLVNTIMAHLINNNFEKITSLKETFFQGSSVNEQQELCEQLSKSVSRNLNKATGQHIINDITIRSIQNSATLNIYFDEIIESCKSHANKKPLEKDVILEAIKYIDMNFSKEITLSAVSKHISLNASYFSDFFKKQTGECFSDFLLKIRMEHAKNLLKNNPNMKIQNICEKVGYKSMPYFYKVFQSYTGYSPTEYRNITE